MRPKAEWAIDSEPIRAKTIVVKGWEGGRLCSVSTIKLHAWREIEKHMENNVSTVFVNYAHFSKKCRTYASTFYFKFGKNTSITMQQTSIWQTHLPYLHLEL